VPGSLVGDLILDQHSRGDRDEGEGQEGEEEAAEVAKPGDPPGRHLEQESERQPPRRQRRART
jgi:hypothetical protein